MKKKSSNLPFKQDFELSKYFNHAEVIKDTAEQIIKDFGESGHEIHINEDDPAPYKTLRFQIIELVKQWILDDQNRFMRLLYKIDISEQHIAKIIRLNKNKDHSEIIADTIIERELKKVLTRHYFSNPEKFEQ